MNGHLLVINCDPAPAKESLCSALAAMYAAGAHAAGLRVHGLEIATLRFLSEGIAGSVPQQAVADIVRAANHIAIILPLPENYPGVGLMPAFVVDALAPDARDTKLFGKRVVQLVVSTHLPAFLYRARMATGSGPAEMKIAGVHELRVAFVGGAGAWSTRDTLQQLDFVRTLGSRCARPAATPIIRRLVEACRRIPAGGTQWLESLRSRVSVLAGTAGK